MTSDEGKLTSRWPWWVHCFALGVLSLLIILLIGVSASLDGGDVWKSWSEGKELRRSAYAEQVFPDRLFRTRSNTWSNLAYVLVGLYCIALAWHDRTTPEKPSENYLTGTPAMSLLFGIACCQLGFGSGLFHASLTRLGQQIDVASMYAPLLTMLAASLGRWSLAWLPSRLQGLPTTTVLVIVVIACTGFLFVYKWSMSSTVVLSSLIATVGLSIVVDQFCSSTEFELKWLCWSFVLLVAGVWCRELDIAGRFSGPSAIIQGHAVWHLLTSLSLASLYCYHRSESVAPRFRSK